MHLSARAIGIWAVLAVAVAAGAFLVGKGSGSEPSGPTASAATGPHPIDVPQLGEVAALPAMRHPKKPARQVSDTSETGESGETYEPTGEVEETYEPTGEVEETYEPTGEEGPVESTGETSSAGPAETSSHSEPTHTETPSTGSAEELVPEG
jgi:hypothetical protein